jgi:hypothetical protein
LSAREPLNRVKKLLIFTSSYHQLNLSLLNTVSRLRSLLKD